MTIWLRRRRTVGKNLKVMVSFLNCLISVPVRVGEAVVHERGGRPHRLRGRGNQVFLPRGRRPDTGKTD